MPPHASPCRQKTCWDNTWRFLIFNDKNACSLWRQSCDRARLLELGFGPRPEIGGKREEYRCRPRQKNNKIEANEHPEPPSLRGETKL